MEPMWTPSEQAIEQAQLTQFARHAVRKHKLELNSYPEFYQWTVDDPEAFWNEVWEWCGVRASRKGGTVLVDGETHRPVDLLDVERGPNSIVIDGLGGRQHAQVCPLIEHYDHCLRQHVTGNPAGRRRLA